MSGSLFRNIAAVLSLFAAFAVATESGKERGLEALRDAKEASSGTHQFKEVNRLTELPSWPTSLAFSMDDKLVAIGLKDQIQLMDVSSKSVTKTIATNSGQVRSIAFSSDGKLMAAGSYQKITLFNAQTFERIAERKGHRGYVNSVAFSNDSQRFATASDDETAKIWSVDKDEAEVTLKGHSYPVNGVAWSPDSQSVATAAGDDTRPTKPGQDRLWDAKSGQLLQSFDFHLKASTGAVFTLDGKYLLTSSVDERVNVYNLAEQKPKGFFGGHSRPTNAVVVHPDGKTAISISGGRAVGKNELCAWEFETGEVIAMTEAHNNKCLSLALSHDGHIVVTGGQDRTVALWNASFASGNTETAETKPVAAASTVAANAEDSKLAAESPKATTEGESKVVKIGIIGLDTSHAEVFTKVLNANPPKAGLEGYRIVAAYPKGSPDIQTSIVRVPAYTESVKRLGVEIVDSIDDLLKKVDVVMLETNDGRPHFEQLLPCLKAKKPTFIDKPVAGSLADAIAIFEAAKKFNVPVFSSSSLRFGKTSQEARAGSLGKITKCETSSPASLEATHPDLFWYGVHGVESLFTVMGMGCQSVTRGKTEDGLIEVIGKWDGDRVGIFREAKGYQGKAVGEKGEGPVGSYDGYDPLVVEIIKFYKTGKPPVSAEETIEIFAFMEAADESKRQDGASVTLESVIAKARPAAMKKVAEIKD